MLEAYVEMILDVYQLPGLDHLFMSSAWITFGCLLRVLIYSGICKALVGPGKFRRYKAIRIRLLVHSDETH